MYILKVIELPSFITDVTQQFSDAACIILQVFHIMHAFLSFHWNHSIPCGCFQMQYVEPAIIVSACVVWMNQDSRRSR